MQKWSIVFLYEYHRKDCSTVVGCSFRKLIYNRCLHARRKTAGGVYSDMNRTVCMYVYTYVYARGCSVRALRMRLKRSSKPARHGAHNTRATS